jgi:ATP-dependent DNA helicase RecQ
VEGESWEGVDRGLFDRLRGWRRLLAEKRGVPPYVVMHDSTLRSLARIRPTSEAALAGVAGMGERRKGDYGLELLEIVRSYCAEHKLGVDQVHRNSETSYIKPARVSKAKQQAFEMFKRRSSLDDVKHTINRARSTVIQYLVEFIAAERPRDIDCWIDRATYRAVAETAKNAEERRLTPVFEQLDGRVSFDEIRLVLAHIEALGAAHSPK